MAKSRPPRVAATETRARGTTTLMRRALGPVIIAAAVLALVAWTIVGGRTGTAPLHSRDVTSRAVVAPSGVTPVDGAAALRARGQRLVLPVEQRIAAPPISVQTTSFGDGHAFTLAAARGDVVVLYFIAGWCTTCIPEAQALARIQETYAPRGVRILALDVEQTEGEGALARFRTQAGSGRYLWALDEQVTVARTYDVQALDTTVVIDRDGRVAYRSGVAVDYGTLASVIEALL